MRAGGVIEKVELPDIPVRAAGGRKFFCVFKIGSSIQLDLDM